MDAFQKIGGRWEIEKDPDATCDYTFDWSDWLLVDGVSDEITSATVTVTGSSTMTKGATNIVDTEKVVVWLSGGAVRDLAAVTCQVVTVGGRTDERTFYIRVKER